MSDEIDAIRAINETLAGLDDEQARQRVLTWAIGKYGAGVGGKALGVQEVTREDPRQFADFPSLFEAARPRSIEERALVAGYWFQTAQGQSDLDSQSLNTALKNLGHGIANITDALSGLIRRRPALVLQVRKSGKSKQARKKYRLTAAGIQAVQRMVSGEPLNGGDESQ